MAASTNRHPAFIGAASGAPAGAQRAGSSALEKDVLFYMYYPYSKRNAVLRPRFDRIFRPCEH